VNQKLGLRHFHLPYVSKWAVTVVPREPTVFEIDCGTVLTELSNYLDGDLTPQLRRQIQKHVESCRHCTALYDGIRNVVELMGDERIIDLPSGFSQRLHRRLLSSQ